MKNLTLKFKKYFTDRSFILSLLGSFILFAVSLVVNFYAGEYATEKASNFVNDIVLNNIPVFDVDLIFIYGPVFLWLFVTALCLADPKKIPFVLKSVALFVLIRSAFVSLTHIGPFPDQIQIDYTSDFIKKFTFGGDLFFSGHTGLPFLMALVFNKNTFLKILFAATAVFFGAVVLLAHLHYTIDVVSAFFITYTIYHLAKLFFKKDYLLFHSN